jgi:DDE superfamily endonuclease
VAVVSGKGSGRVSAAGMTCYKPGARSRFFYRIRIHTGRKGERRSLSEADYAGLITAAHQQLHAPLILCWDNLNTHISGAMRTMLQAHRDWLTVVQMPSYAPDLNPVEGAWSTMKAAWATWAPAAHPTGWPRSSRTGSSASSTGPPSSTDSSPKLASASNPNHRRTRPRPFNPCSKTTATKPIRRTFMASALAAP